MSEIHLFFKLEIEGLIEKFLKLTSEMGESGSVCSGVAVGIGIFSTQFPMGGHWLTWGDLACPLKNGRNLALRQSIKWLKIKNVRF